MLESHAFRYCGHFGRLLGGSQLSSDKEAVALYSAATKSTHLFVIEDVSILANETNLSIRASLADWLVKQGLVIGRTLDDYELIRNYL